MARQTAITFFLFLATAFASADGKFNITTQSSNGFTKLTVMEKDGVREGVWMNGANYSVSSYLDGDMLRLNIGAYTDYLQVKTDEVSSYYRGRLWSMNKITTLNSYIDKNGGIKVVGTIAEEVNVEVLTNPKKGTFYMYWEDYVMEIKTNPAKGAGACKGRLMIGSNEVLKINCQSSGELQDAIFNNPQDIISWMIHLFVIPKDN